MWSLYQHEEVLVALCLLQSGLMYRCTVSVSPYQMKSHSSLSVVDEIIQLPNFKPSFINIP